MKHECKYENQWDRIHDKLDKIDSTLNNNQVILTKQEENLKEHMRRTAILEKTLKPLNNIYNSVLLLVGVSGFIVTIWKLFV